MRNLQISTRIALMLGLLALLLAAVGGLGLWGIVRTNDGLGRVYRQSTVPMGQIAEIQARLLRSRLAIAVALVTPEPEVMARSSAEVEANIEAIGRLWAGFGADAAASGPELQALAQQFAADRGRFVQDGLRPTVAALRSNDRALADRLVVEKIRPLYAPVGAGIQQIMEAQLAAAAREEAAAQARYRSLRNAALAAIAAGLLCAGALGLLLVRGIRRDLAQAVAATEAVARGDLTLEVRSQGRDELARLLHSLGAMRHGLAELVGRVRGGAQSVASASAQIAQGNVELSSRTEEQAAALEQTAASMEQLGATVRNNTDAARQADQLAQGARAVAQRGGEAVAQVVQTMHGISESAQRIAEIIGIIDGIAFQTNILSLNAAVEAAQAGEHGRGFAVVATEVRTLAQRSAAAAREIKDLITASVDRVEAGSRLADQAGATMDEVVDAVRRVSDLISEINAASVEQSAGVNQIGVAVNQLDQTTQHNAQLVEESAAAAASLHDQAQQLVSAVSVFRVELAPTAG